MKITNEQLKRIIKEELEIAMESYEERKAEKERAQTITGMKEVTARKAVDKFDSIIAKEYGLSIGSIEEMISKEGVEFEGNKYFRVKDLSDALTEKEINSLDQKRIKFSDNKTFAPSIGYQMLKLIRPIIKNNRGFINKTFNFAKGRGFKQ
jgi:hypothetical protein|tara:strand:+ start:132 stop:584 length:453 start_codon:yes stop_codon:yes gene_type:complete